MLCWLGQPAVVEDVKVSSVRDVCPVMVYVCVMATSQAMLGLTANSTKKASKLEHSFTHQRSHENNNYDSNLYQ
jgi:hypothetical protein